MSHKLCQRARPLALLLLIAILAGCSASAAPATPSGAVAEAAAPLPTARRLPSPTPPAPTAASSATPAPTQPAAPSATPAPAGDPFLEAQAAALVPERAGDLARANEWDRYTITAALSPDERVVRGSLRVELVNRSASPYEQIWFHLYPNHPDFGGRLDVTSASVDGQPVGSGTLNGDTLIRLDLPAPLAPGARAVAELGFSARTPRGASANIFGAFNQEAGVWSLANFYPVLARQLPGQGWDTRPISSRGDFAVSSTALYDVTIDAPADWTLVSTGVSIDSSAVNEAVRRERFVSGPQREFYLAALQPGAIEQASSVVEGTRIVSYYQPGNPAAGQRALAVAEQSIRAFNARYGRYPLAELEVIQAALTTFLGMEYPGAVLIEQQLYRNNGSSLETTVAHEIAHQWWYSLIGNDAQAEPWLDEGMASYAQVLYYESLGQTEAREAELDSFRDMYRRAREAGRDAPLASPPDALRGNYVPIVYAKGALFFHALRAQIGEAAFGRFLQGYYAAGLYRDVSGPELLAAAEAACECQLDSLYQDWVLSAARVTIP